MQLGPAFDAGPDLLGPILQRSVDLGVQRKFEHEIDQYAERDQNNG